MDAYQQAVEWLTERPDEIVYSWRWPHVARGGCLFKRCSKDDCPELCGCLTEVRRQLEMFHPTKAATEELTLAIRKDERIPKDPLDITPDHLPVFAQWQRYIDAVLGRIPPKLDDRIPRPQGNIEIPDDHGRIEQLLHQS